MKKIGILHTFNSYENLTKDTSFDDIIFDMDYLYIVDGWFTDPTYPHYVYIMKKREHNNTYHSIDGSLDFVREQSNKYEHVDFHDSIYIWTCKEEMLNFCVDKFRKQNLDDEPCLLHFFNHLELPTIDYIKEKRQKLVNNIEEKSYVCNDGKQEEGGIIFKWEGQYFLSHFPLLLKEIVK